MSPLLQRIDSSATSGPHLPPLPRRRHPHQHIGEDDDAAAAMEDHRGVHRGEQQTGERERRLQRRRTLAQRAYDGNSKPAAPSASKVRRLFLYAGPEYLWEDTKLTVSSGPADKRVSVIYWPAAMTETELRRLSRAIAVAPELISDLLASGEAAHPHIAVEMAADALDDTGPVDLNRTVAVCPKGGRLGNKKPEREE